MPFINPLPRGYTNENDVMVDDHVHLHATGEITQVLSITGPMIEVEVCCVVKEVRWSDVEFRQRWEDS